MTMVEVPSTMPRFRIPRMMYDQMVDAGILEGQHVELIDGEIVEMSPINYPHVVACTLVSELLREAFGKGFHIRVQAPLAIDDSEPQPDISVNKGNPRDIKHHPSSAELVVEVSDSTFRFDLGEKASLYASAKIEDYWVLNLKQSQLHVFRGPRVDRSQRFGYGYGEVRVLKKKDLIVPLNAPKGAPIKVANMLP